MKVSVDPAALRAAAGPLVTLAYDVGTVHRGLSGQAELGAGACGDAGLAEGIRAFSARVGGEVGELGRVVDLLGQALVAVAEAYSGTDAGAMPSGSGG